MCLIDPFFKSLIISLSQKCYEEFCCFYGRKTCHPIQIIFKTHNNSEIVVDLNDLSSKYLLNLNSDQRLILKKILLGCSFFKTSFKETFSICGTGWGGRCKCTSNILAKDPVDLWWFCGVWFIWYYNVLSKWMFFFLLLFSGGRSVCTVNSVLYIWDSGQVRFDVNILVIKNALYFLFIQSRSCALSNSNTTNLSGTIIEIPP